MGKGATTTTNSVQLGGQGSLESFLSGSGGLSPQEQRELEFRRSGAGGGLLGFGGNDDKRLQELEAKAKSNTGGFLQSQFKDLQSMLTQNGPGASDVGAATGASRDLASMLAEYSRTGGLPGQGDISAANSFATDIFGARQVGLNQQFTQMGQQASREAALSGRGSADPILRARLMESQAGMQDMLNAEKTGFASQYAQQLSGNRLSFAGQRADVLNALGNQATQNRLALLGLGSSLNEAERGWRLNNATRVSKQEKEVGLGDVFTGAIGLAGAVTGIGGMLAGGSAAIGGAAKAGAAAGSLGNNIFGVGQGVSQFAGQYGANPGIPGSDFSFYGPNQGISMPSMGSGFSSTPSYFGYGGK